MADPCNKPPLQIQRGNVKSRRRSPGVNAPMPPMTPLLKPPRWRLNSLNSCNRQRGIPRKEAQVPGRVAAPPNQRSAIARRNYGNCITQLKCKQCQIAVISHSCDSHSFNAKYLISSGYLIVHELLVFLVVPMEIEVATCMAAEPLTSVSRRPTAVRRYPRSPRPSFEATTWRGWR
jgi:hypothetical protein